MRHPTPHGRSQASTIGAPTAGGSGKESDGVCRGQEGP